MMLTKNEILKILETPEMNGNFWIFDEYGNSHQILSRDFSDVTLAIANALYNKKAIWIRGLESLPKLSNYCKEIKAINCHVILAPAGSTVLRLHKDEWDVYIKMLYGYRVYKIQDKEFTLYEGQELTIQKGIYHQVFCPVDSATINFGIEPQYLSVLSNHDFFVRWEDDKKSV